MTRFRDLNPDEAFAKAKRRLVDLARLVRLAMSIGRSGPHRRDTARARSASFRRLPGAATMIRSSR